MKIIIEFLIIVILLTIFYKVLFFSVAKYQSRNKKSKDGQNTN